MSTSVHDFLSVLACAVAGHRWAWNGPDTWAMTCSRCRDQYYLPKF